MIKRFHEAPKSAFSMVQKETDGDYFLVHLFESDPEYLQLAKDSVAKGREVILDNSIFELGTAFNMKKFADWVNDLKPTYYIVPDSLDDTEETCANMRDWCANYRSDINPKCKMIGVVQGKTWADLVECYEYLVYEAKVDKVAFSFDSAYYRVSFPHPNVLISNMMGRIQFLSQMVQYGIIDPSVKSHLLGCSLPQEFKYYDKETFSWIDSVDTSNPVVAGINRELYDQSDGLTKKDSTKLYTLMNEQVDDQQKAFIEYNIGVFKKFCEGNWFSFE